VHNRQGDAKFLSEVFLALSSSFEQAWYAALQKHANSTVTKGKRKLFLNNIFSDVMQLTKFLPYCFRKKN